MALDVLHHHDRVVHDDTDGEHDRKQGHRVRGIADGVEDNKSADQADRHRDGGNERGAQISQEEKDHKDDENEGFDQCLLHLMDRFLHENGGIIRDLPREILGKGFREVCHLGLDGVHRGDRVRAGGLVDGQRRRRLAVKPCLAIQVRRA